MTRLSSIARGLGWFSLALGALEIAAPGVFERAVGARGRSRLLLPAIGVREIISGIGILRARRPLPLWLWTRVAGDLADLGLVLLTMRQEALTRGSRAARIARADLEPSAQAVLVDRPLENCRRFWNAFAESPRFQRDFSTLRAVHIEAGPDGQGSLIRVYMPPASKQVERRARESLALFKQVVERDGKSSAAPAARTS